MGIFDCFPKNYQRFPFYRIPIFIAKCLFFFSLRNLRFPFSSQPNSAEDPCMFNAPLACFLQQCAQNTQKQFPAPTCIICRARKFVSVLWKTIKTRFLKTLVTKTHQHTPPHSLGTSRNFPAFETHFTFKLSCFG